MDCTGLTSVSIPGSVEYIGEYAFTDCTAMASVTIGDSITYIGTDAFKGTAFYGNENNWTDGVLYISHYLIAADAEKVRGTYNIRPGTRLVGSYAFYDCSGLTSVTFPEEMVGIGHRAFELCTSLTEIAIPEGVSSIAWATFSKCTSLSSVTIPGSVTSIEGQAFKDCISLASVIIPGSVTSLGTAAFSGCTSLASIVIPNSVTSIGSSAFYGCTGLTSVTIPDGITNIENGTFSSCRSLISIDIPGSVTSFGTSAFYDCVNLAEMTVRATTPPNVTDYNVFHNVDRFLPLYVLAESVEAYNTADYWDYFLNIYPLDEKPGSGMVLPKLDECITVVGNEVRLIHVNDTIEVQVYDMMGRHVMRITDTHFVLPQGFYIIEVGHEAAKVSIR